MKGKCLECENYYLAMRFRKDLGGGQDEIEVEVYECASADITCLNVPSGHPLKLDAEGHYIKMLECNSFEPKREDKP